MIEDTPASWMSLGASLASAKVLEQLRAQDAGKNWPGARGGALLKALLDKDQNGIIRSFERIGIKFKEGQKPLDGLMEIMSIEVVRMRHKRIAAIMEIAARGTTEGFLKAMEDAMSELDPHTI